MCSGEGIHFILGYVALPSTSFLRMRLVLVVKQCSERRRGLEQNANAMSTFFCCVLYAFAGSLLTLTKTVVVQSVSLI